MRYIGSKLRLTNFIESTVKKYCGKELSEKVFCDLFAGTGVVGRTFSPMVKKVIANDLEKYSFIANYVQLKGYNQEVWKKYFSCLEYDFSHNYVDEYNKDRNLIEAYTEGGSKNRLFFCRENGEKIQAARNRLSQWSKHFTYEDYFAILYTIIEGADKVANTMSTYGMFASKLKDNALKPVEFKEPKTAENAGPQNEVYMTDANELIKQIKGDILYLDPPYNQRQYSSYYFVLNAIAENRAPETDTKSGVKNDECNKSSYNKKKEVANSLEELIKNADFEWIFLSYNNEGLLSFDEIKAILERYGNYWVESTDYQRYKADNNRNQAADGVVEYIHVLHKGVFDEDEKYKYVNVKFTIVESPAHPLEPFKSWYENVKNAEQPAENADNKPQGTIRLKKIVFKSKDEIEDVKAVDIPTAIEDVKPVDIPTEIDMPEELKTWEAQQKFQQEFQVVFPINEPDKNGRVYRQEVVTDAVNKWTELLKKEGCRHIIGELSHQVRKDFKYKEVTSPMNYMGGKKKLLPYILPCFPKTSKFLDLFCGGATVGINSQSSYVWFNDIIEPLMGMYRFMSSHSSESCLGYIDATIKKWNLTQENEDAYYAFRKQYNDTPVNDRHPLDLFVLMAYSFNNQIRFNEKKMNFNIPFGKNRSSFNSKMRENLIGFIDALHEKQCVFTSYDFRNLSMGSVLGFEYPEDTFVYADPPYLVSQATYNSGWDEDTERALLDFLQSLDKRGYKFALSNVLENKGQRNTILEEWVNKNNYNVIHIEKSYANSYYHRKNKETKTDEVLITNYETQI